MPKIGAKKIAPIVADSGTFGFFGEGYWWHWMVWPFIWFLKKFGTFTAKTVTAESRDGNMPLNPDGTPRDWFPKCIFIDLYRWFYGCMLNAVGLSNHGVEACLEDGRWQRQNREWILSFMPIANSVEEKLAECRHFVEETRKHLQKFWVKPIIAFNVSCPNVGLMPLFTVGHMLDILGELNLEIIVKVSVDMSVSDAIAISQHSKCSAIHVSNTLHWSKLPEDILRRAFPDCRDGSRWISPLDQFGGGGYSGKGLLPLVLAWICDAKDRGLEKPIIGGGGILTPLDVWRVRRAGASAVAVASVAMLRPWRIPFLVFAAYLYDARRH